MAATSRFGWVPERRSSAATLIEGTRIPGGVPRLFLGEQVVRPRVEGRLAGHNISVITAELGQARHVNTRIPEGRALVECAIASMATVVISFGTTLADRPPPLARDGPEPGYAGLDTKRNEVTDVS